MSDPSFERSSLEEYYTLYFETKMLLGRVNNRDYKPIFIVFFVKFYLCKVFFVKVHGWSTVI